MESPQKLLDAAYEHLGYAEGDLFDAVDSPSELTSEDWLNKGEWLSLAKTVGAEKVFFVEDNPVIVFASSHIKKHKDRFQQIWNMARPPLLFLASPGELGVYDLTRGPARSQVEWDETVGQRLLDRVSKIADVSTKLWQYRRDQVESGRLFEEKAFGEGQRADMAIISDLRAVRANLIKSGLKPEYAHSLIGRSIFIRYLEDRGILTKNYFKKTARGKPEWRSLLEEPLCGSFADLVLAGRLYFRVLGDKSFTYALFEQLSKDFNGDIFPNTDLEHSAVKAEHLHTLRDFLCGNATYRKLFFFAYKFDIIPIELISSIYEEFYNTDKSKSENKGSHYTPPALVEYLLSKVLTSECLSTHPRIMDGACGSGIFLVEAFKRIVRYRVQKQKGRRLNDVQLRKVIREQLTGIDTNEEAIRVAAFSLYLAFLHYQKTADILEQIKRGRRLPNLKYEKGRRINPNQHYNTLLAANAFDVESKISPSHTHVLSRFSESCADIVVGNPPWGSPGNKEEERENRGAMDVALEWCHKQKPSLTVGDREWSQAFVHRTVKFLRQGGTGALLLSSGVLFKSQEKSQAFRKEWLSNVTLKSVVNFAHVRNIFFKGKARRTGAMSPFISTCFTKKPPNSDSFFDYWSAKKTAIVKGTQTVILGKLDIKSLSQNDVLDNDNLWKIYWWGSYRDKNLVDYLRSNEPLEKSVVRCIRFTPTDFGQGFKEGKTVKKEYSDELLRYKEFPVQQFERYGPLDQTKFVDVPKRVHAKGDLNLYEGHRLLIKRGITEKQQAIGQIFARLAKEPFCFRNSIHGVRLPPNAIWESKVLLGIFWSSLARYYYWLTSGSWMWHNEIHLQDVRQMPIKLPENKDLRDRIVRTVEKLQSLKVENADVGLFGQSRGLRELESELDKAIFDLYELNEAERDLIRDMCKYGLDLFYNNVNSTALQPVESNRPADNCGVFEDVPTRRDWQKGFEGYIRTFLRIWNRELEPDGEFRWQLIRPGRDIPMVAMVFSTQYKGKPLNPVKGPEENQWNKVLEKLNETLVMPVSKRVYIDGVVRAVSDTDIMIVKRNERRLWTRSMAREDAEATLLRAMNIQSKNGGR